jgi:23S rRNA (uracil1939-C5)-methyltransferase
VEIKIDSLAYGGDGVGRVDGKVCFVKGALPGETVEVRIIKETSKFIKAEVSNVIEPSPDRITPECHYYDKCGGCQLQHLSYDKEVSYKLEQVRDLISRIGGIEDYAIEGIEPSNHHNHYRSAITLHKCKDGYGFYMEDGKTVMPIDKCLIADQPINDKLEESILSVKEDRLTLKSDHRGIVWSSCRTGERFYVDRYGKDEITLSPKAFSQCNKHIAEQISGTLSAWIGEVAPGTTFFDVYCGAGLFSFILNNAFDHIVGMDSDRVAINCAKTTLTKYARENIKFYRGDVETDFMALFERSKTENNIILVDPPRKGIDKFFLAKLAALKEVNALYYVSCDPSRLARDMKLMTSSGKWKVARVKAFDMFPRTKHIEVMAEIVRC